MTAFALAFGFGGGIGAVAQVVEDPFADMVEIAALNAAAAALQGSAVADVAGIEAGMKDLGGTSAARHKDYRQPEQ